MSQDGAMVRRARAPELAPWRQEMLVFGRPLFGEEERREILACIESGWLGTGPRVARFEREFAEWLGVEEALAVSSCTAALHLALWSLDLPPGGEVITSAVTFAATANAILQAGLVPVFADCRPDSMNLAPESVAARVTPRTVAIVPVHLGGRPCDMPAITALARRHGLAVVEDCAHAVEARVDGRACGTFGDAGCFSFYVTKNATTVEGGMVVVRDPARSRRMRRAAMHGLDRDAWQRAGDGVPRPPEVVSEGFKYNMTDLAASLGIHQLRRLEAGARHRRALWERYDANLADLPLILPEPPEPRTRHARHLYSVRVDPARSPLDRDQLRAGLAHLRIGTGVHYTALHLHPYFRERLGGAPGDLPVAERIGETTLSLPLSPAVSDEDADDVVRALHLLLA